MTGGVRDNEHNDKDNEHSDKDTEHNDNDNELVLEWLPSDIVACNTTVHPMIQCHRFNGCLLLLLLPVSYHSCQLVCPQEGPQAPPEAS